MKIRLGLISWATGTLLLVAVSACGGTSPDPGATHSGPPSVPASPTVRHTSPSNLAAASATDVVHRYYATLDEVRQNARVPISKLDEVETSVELAADRRLVSRERSKGLHQVGRAKLQELTVQSVNLDNSDPATGKVPTVVIDVCWDVSTVDILNPDGKSVVRPTRPDQGLTRYLVSNYHWAADPTNGWRVVSGQDLKLAPCAS